jgi:hypothetical protein
MGCDRHRRRQELGPSVRASDGTPHRTHLARRLGGDTPGSNRPAATSSRASLAATLQASTEVAGLAHAGWSEPGGIAASTRSAGSIGSRRAGTVAAMKPFGCRPERVQLHRRPPGEPERLRRRGELALTG